MIKLPVKNHILRKNARAQLGGSIFAKPWLMVLVVYLVYTVIVSAASTVTAGIGSLILAGPMLFGVNRVCIYLVKGKSEVEIEDTFCGFKECFAESLLLSLMTGIFTFLWSLLFIIPGIVKGYSYAMAPYILHDDPEKDWRTCLDESKKMMEGNKWQLFCLDLSFLGWMIVGVLCFGIGTLFVNPYKGVSKANFYMALKAQYEPIVEETAEQDQQ